MQNPFTLSFGKKPLQYISRISQTNQIVETFRSENPVNQLFMITGAVSYTHLNTIDYVRINEKKKTMRFNTSLLHAGVTKETNVSTLPPVYQTSAFEQESAADLEKIFENKAPGY